MGMFVLRLLTALVATWLVFGARAAHAQSSDPNCASGLPDGFKVLGEHSTTEIPAGNPTSFVCNARSNRAGLAVTIEYACAAETEAAWKSKTANRTKNVVSKSSTEVLVRELHSVSGYAGEFSGSEKLFIRVDARTIATVYVMSDRQDDSPTSALFFSAEDAASYARGRATANAPFSSNWKCPEGDVPPTPTSQPQPPTTGTGATSTSPAPTPGDKKTKSKEKEKEAEAAPFLGLSWPVILVMVTVVVLVGAGFTWIVRRPRRVQPR